jgi:hypothetical protein
MNRVLFLFFSFLFLLNYSLFGIGSSSQEILHQAITKGSIKDIKKAIQDGANINIGIGEVPPLLVAVLLGEDIAAQELLNNGANPNISYLNRHIVFQIKNLELKSLFLKKGLTLSDKEKQDIIDSIICNISNNPGQKYFEMLKILGYDIKNSFTSSDLTKNSWFNALVKHPMNHRNGRSITYSDLPSLEYIKLFITNGANPNQIFILPDGTTWTPLLLIIDNYLAAHKRGAINESYYHTATNNLLRILLDGGADINQVANPISKDKSESALSLAFAEEGQVINRHPLNLDFIILFLIQKNAAVEEGIRLYLENGGSPNKAINFSFMGPMSFMAWAVENNNTKVVKLLLGAGVTVDQGFLVKALAKGNADMIKLIMESIKHT